MGATLGRTLVRCVLVAVSRFSGAARFTAVFQRLASGQVPGVGARRSLVSLLVFRFSAKWPHRRFLEPGGGCRQVPILPPEPVSLFSRYVIVVVGD